MSEPLRILHGAFGRIALLRLDRTMVLHAHHHCHVIFKVGGQDSLFGIGKREYPLADDGVLLINAWEPHFYEHRAAAEPTVLLAFYLDPDWLRQVDGRFAHSNHPRFFPQSAAGLSPRLERVRFELLEMLTARDASMPAPLEAAIVEVFAEITMRTPPRPGLGRAGSLGELAWDARIRRAVGIMKESGGVAIAFDALAGRLGLSHPHFFRLFRRDTGLTPATYANMLRMEASLQGIASGARPLQEIALDLGFDSPANFTRFFAGQQGVSPGKYRKALEFVGAAGRAATP